MYIETVPNRNSRPLILLRKGWREGKKRSVNARSPISPAGRNEKSNSYDGY
jgi:hypothetical protein